ncbi:3-methyl-2-oxobutanoate hydroxymethyltransferase [Desulfonatronum thioautotrophicum]|uniref:3-methyl-2-oxobutanoate hydroxymethyltransferase n=1 Tax=Desulfonatronum thioautotrophicum TaxID=617001 RepID=UPI0005EBA0B8|nr:3-methyl-2-oxobutanoate hydroxymethyltransferase [Desulfonatronum thioautotrophicum]
MHTTTTATLLEMKRRGEKITVLTAYDWATAKLLDDAGVEMLLVGDSLGMVMLGLENTLAVTMDDMLHHCKAVARGAKQALLVGDMPFMSYQVSPEQALANAGRFLQEGGMHAVKVEGGRDILPAVRKMTRAGIPVLGHVGLTPQHVHQLGGFKVQGRTDAAAQRIREDAVALEEAGAFSLVLECVPAPLAQVISEQLTIPTIGIGAGPGCDGQVLVFHDVVGLYDRFTPKFVKQYAQIGAAMREAVRQYVQEVKDGTFPGEEHVFK